MRVVLPMCMVVVFAVACSSSSGGSAGSSGGPGAPGGPGSGTGLVKLTLKTK